MALLVLAALASPISQLTLAPVFGSILSSVNHGTMITLTFISGLMCRRLGVEFKGNATLIAVWAAWMPVVQYLLLPFNSRLGPVMGPVLNGFLSCHTILIPTAYDMAESLVAAGVRPDPRPWAPLNMILTAVSTLLFRILERTLSLRITTLLAAVRFLTPVHLQLLLAACYSFVFPSWLLVFAVPAFLHAQFMNPHFSSAALDGSLQTHNWTLLERQWSNTGYISVLDSFEMEYRVMRCDHSLLGGEWLLTEKRTKKEGWKVNEPIYAVFQMLEAVRLMQVEPTIPDSEAQALVIGLGIGTAPKALVAHGIQTTVVELDPVVHEFATRYFGLPANHTAVIQDAVSWVKEEAAAEKRRYDYIIHDVFTGGTEPLSLFNAQFLGNLRTLLTPNGVIAINYAGDLALPLTSTVLNTIDTVFSGQCKIFRDGPPEKDNDPTPGDGEASSDFLNMVVFCRNSQGDIAFRKPSQADYLGSKSRQYYMLPKPEHEIQFPQRRHADVVQQQQTSTASRSGASANAQQQREDHHGHGQGRILELGDEGTFDAEQGRSALRHWRIMRKVLPNAVWDLW